MSQTLDFGERAIYIWASYGIVAFVLLGLILIIVTRERRLARLAQDVRTKKNVDTGDNGQGYDDE